MHRRIFPLLFTVWLTGWVVPAHAADYLSTLTARARELGLAADPQWHLLLHYQKRTLGAGVMSAADDREFFNAPDGKANAEAELAATLAAFFSDVEETDTRQNPQCRFIARYRWLKERLGFDPARLPERPCRRYAKWREQLDPKSITLVFPTAYLNSPASMYGHTLLRVDATDQDDRTRLLAYTISYAAQTDETNGLTFAYRGLFGGYPGRFSMMPYYLKVAEYSDLESRDLWEYELDLTAAEIERLLEHTWELGPTNFDYYFLDENCAYQLLSLLDAARPSLRLTDRFPLWTIPAESVRAITQTPGLVRRTVYRPARSTEVRHQARGLSPEELAVAVDLAAGQLTAEEGLKRTDLRRGAVFDLAYDYLDYRRLGGKDRAPDPKGRLRSLLLARSRVDAPPPDPVPVPDVRPDQGHLATRLSVGGGTSEGNGFQELRYRPAYHDLLDPERGYRPGAQIEFLNVAARHENGDGLRLERVTFINVTSISKRDDLLKSPSWRADVGVERTRLPDGSQPLIFQATGATGVAYGIGERAIVYGMIEAGLLGSTRLQPMLAPGIGLRVGAVAEPHPRWRIQVHAASVHYATDRPRDRQSIGVDQNVELTTSLALRLEAVVRREFGVRWSTVGAYLQWYF